MKDIPFFTIGFAGKSAEQFFEILKNAKVQRILDVRLFNHSQLAGHTKYRDFPFFLKSILNADYIHLDIFAPTKNLLNNFKKGLISWADYEQQYKAILLNRKPFAQLNSGLLNSACLLCSEARPDHCHRRLAAEYLQKIWPNLKITHL